MRISPRSQHNATSRRPIRALWPRRTVHPAAASPSPVPAAPARPICQHRSAAPFARRPSWLRRDSEHQHQSLYAIRSRDRERDVGCWISRRRRRRQWRNGSGQPCGTDGIRAWSTDAATAITPGSRWAVSVGKQSGCGQIADTGRVEAQPSPGNGCAEAVGG